MLFAKAWLLWRKDRLSAHGLDEMSLLWSPSWIMPYRVYFPLSILFSICGAAVWVWPLENTLVLHRELMISGFLLSAAFGFLFTALPHFISAPKPSPVFLRFFLTVYMSALFGLMLDNMIFYLAMMSLTITVFLYFIFSSLRRKQGYIPFFFPYILWAFVAGGIGILLRLIGAIDSTFSESLLRVGQLLYFHGLFLILVVGIGQKMGVMLMGTSVSPKVIRYFYNLRLGHIYAALIIVSYCLQEWLHPQAGLAARAVLLTWILGFGWNLFGKWKKTGAPGFWIRILGYTTIGALFTEVLLPAYYVHLSHATLMGIVGMFALIIMSRVFHGHENLSGNFEKNKWYAHLIWGVLYLAISTRVSAYFLKSYTVHLVIAGIFWMVCMVILAVYHAVLFYRKEEV